MSVARTNTDPIRFAPGEVTEAARHREERIKNALRQHGPATAEQVIERTGLSQSATYADLALLADEGVLVVHRIYALPGQRIAFQRT